MRLSKAMLLCDTLMDVYNEVTSRKLKQYKETDQKNGYTIDWKFNSDKSSSKLKVEADGLSWTMELDGVRPVFATIRKKIWKEATVELTGDSL